jgi:secreted trypsin-like serine protease
MTAMNLRICRLTMFTTVAAATAAPLPASAQSGMQSLPAYVSMYQRKADAVAAGQLPRLFLGSASIAPNYGFPWMVSVEVKKVAPQNGHFCGGVAIDPSWVATAAHCVATAIPANGNYHITAADPDKLQILSGTNVLSVGGRIGAISRIVLHPQFRIVQQRIPDNDIALLKISGSPNLTPLAIATPAQSDEMLNKAASVRIFGWGTASFGPDRPISNTLLFTFVDVVPRATCNDKSIYGGAVTDSMFCAGVGYSDSCQGDSGGPAIGYAEGVPYLTGLVSWGVGCDDRTFPGVYTNVTKFSEWIRETISNPY